MGLKTRNVLSSNEISGPCFSEIEASVILMMDQEWRRYMKTNVFATNGR